MRLSRSPLLLVVAFAWILLPLAQLSCRAQVPQFSTVRSWEFDQPDALDGWHWNQQLEDVHLENGALCGKVTGSDPIFLPPDINLPTAPLQRVVFRYKADAPGVFEIFWAVDHTSGPYHNGFYEPHSLRVSTAGDNQWHTYTLYGGWDQVEKIVALRLDPPGGRYSFALDYFRIEGTTTRLPRSDAVDWDFTRPQDVRKWLALEGCKTVRVTPEGLKVTSDAPLAMLYTPIAKQVEGKFNFVYFEGKADYGDDLELLVGAENRKSQSSFFPFPCDGKLHALNYPLDVKGKLHSLGLRPPHKAGSTLLVKRLKLVEHPFGPPAPWVRYFGFDSGVNRSARPVKVLAAVDNFGGEPLEGAKARLEPGPGLELAPGETAERTLEKLGYGERDWLTWQVVSKQPGPRKARLVLEWAGKRVEQVADLVFTPVPAEAKNYSGDYIPAPKPLKTPYELGCYYFPGWPTASRWIPIRQFFRKPLLGYYAEGDPEVMDWQIKWALEHGITFWIFDWYWNQGHRSLEHGLHDAFFHARFQDRMKFALLWANHNPPHTSSYDDLMKVCDYWIENYFKRPNYLRIDGKPAVWIFSPWRLENDLGQAEVKRAFAAMRAKCEAAGLGGLYLLSCQFCSGYSLPKMQADGYDSGSDYNFAGLNLSGDWRSPYSKMTRDYLTLLHGLAEPPLLPYVPVVSFGWDPRPWHGYTTKVRYGMTPELLRRHAEEVKQLVETTPLTGPAGKLLISEAWNEWGEGSICEPGRRWGFGMLDAFAKVFAPEARLPAELIPSDLGRKTAQVAFDFATHWDFDQPTTSVRGNLDCTVKVKDGLLEVQTLGNDPVITLPAVNFKASKYPYFIVRMAASGGGEPDGMQVFYATMLAPGFTEARSIHLELVKDGKFHTYVLPFGKQASWLGTITSLRFDPTYRPGVTLKIDYLGVYPQAPTGPDVVTVKGE